MSKHELMLTRCDRCGAGTKAIASKDGLSVFLCQHHVDQHREVLEDAGFKVLTEVSEATVKELATVS